MCNYLMKWLFIEKVGTQIMMDDQFLLISDEHSDYSVDTRQIQTYYRAIPRRLPMLSIKCDTIECCEC